MPKSSTKSPKSKPITSTKLNSKKQQKKKISSDNILEEVIAPKPCDRCRKHRVKCDRDVKQCNHCKKHDVKCTYLDIPKKRGPKSKVDKDITKYLNILKECKDKKITKQNVIASDKIHHNTWVKSPSSSDQSTDLSESHLIPINSFNNSLSSDPNYNFNQPFNYCYNLTTPEIPSIFIDDIHNQAFPQNQYPYSTPKLCINDTLMNLPYSPDCFHLDPFNQLPIESPISPESWLNLPILRSPQSSPIFLSSEMSPLLL